MYDTTVDVLPDGSEKPGEGYMRWHCAGLAAYSGNWRWVLLLLLTAP